VKSIDLRVVLSERVGLKTTLQEYIFIPRRDISKWFSYTS